MITQESFTFAKAERLKSTKNIQTLFQKGKAFSVSPYRVHYRLVGQGESPAPIQAGFAVSSRNFARATDRNRIKRLTREAWRLGKGKLIPRVRASSYHLQIFFVYNDREIKSYQEIAEKFSVILTKLERELEKTPPPPGAAVQGNETDQ